MSRHARAVSFPFVSTYYISLWLDSLPHRPLSTREIAVVPRAAQTCSAAFVSPRSSLRQPGWSQMKRQHERWVAPRQPGGEANSFPLVS